MNAAPGWVERTEIRLWLGMAIVITFTGTALLDLRDRKFEHVVRHPQSPR